MSRGHRDDLSCKSPSSSSSCLVLVGRFRRNGERKKRGSGEPGSGGSEEAWQVQERERERSCRGDCGRGAKGRGGSAGRAVYSDRCGRGNRLEDAALVLPLDDGRLERGDDCLVKDVLELRGGSTGTTESVGSDSSTGKRKGELTPFCVNAEHSTYLTAPSSRASRSPASGGTGRCFCLASLSSTAGSSRKSTWVPTMRHGTPGQWWCTSGNHFSLTFSNEAGEVTLKQTRKTSVCGYESGRSRS